MDEQDLAMPDGSCHCLCPYHHREGAVGICVFERDRTVRLNGASADIPMCGPCGLWWAEHRPARVIAVCLLEEPSPETVGRDQGTRDLYRLLGRPVDELGQRPALLPGDDESGIGPLPPGADCATLAPVQVAERPQLRMPTDLQQAAAHRRVRPTPPVPCTREEAQALTPTSYPSSPAEPGDPGPLVPVGAPRCPRCWRTTYHPPEERGGWCGFCQEWTGDPARLRIHELLAAWGTPPVPLELEQCEHWIVLANPPVGAMAWTGVLTITVNPWWVGKLITAYRRATPMVEGTPGENVRLYRWWAPTWAAAYGRLRNLLVDGPPC